MWFKLFIIFLVLIDYIYAVDTSKNTITLDTLILYTPDVAKRYKNEQDTRIRHIIATTNNIFKNSNLNVKLNILKIELYNINSNINAQEILQKVRQDTNISALRDKLGADEVIIYGTYKKSDEICGLGYVNKNNPSYAYAYVSVNCASYNTAHEIGHNLGLYHSEKSFPHAKYARGYGVDNDFETIMAYKKEYNGEKIYKFSSPLLECHDMPCGVEEGYEHEADACKAILENAPVVSLFRASNNKASDIKKVYQFYKTQYEKAQITLNDLYNKYLDADKEYRLYLYSNPPKEEKEKRVALETNKNKLYLSYTAYKNDVYLMIKKQYEEIKKAYDKLKKGKE